MVITIFFRKRVRKKVDAKNSGITVNTTAHEEERARLQQTLKESIALLPETEVNYRLHHACDTEMYSLYYF